MNFCSWDTKRYNDRLFFLKTICLKTETVILAIVEVKASHGNRDFKFMRR